VNEGLTGKGIQEMTPTYFSKGIYDARYNFVLDNPLGLPYIDSMYVVPLLYNGTLVGVLQLFNKINKSGKSLYEID
jgi:hypothetical protein